MTTRIGLFYIHLWRVRSVSVGNVKSWRRISVPGRRWVGELLVAAAVAQLHRPVVRVAHVHRSDHRGRWWVLQTLVSQQTGRVLPVCHRLQNYWFCCCCFVFAVIGITRNYLYGEIWLKLAKVRSPLVHYGVEVVLSIVVISHKTAISLSLNIFVMV